MPQTVLKWLGIKRAPAAEPDSFVNDGDTITVSGITLEVLHTPGHSPGHVSYLLRSNQTVFCGDVLFRGSIGRTDMPNSNYNTLMQSITEKLLPLGDDVIVAPGHGDNTTIGHERRHNGFILEYLASASTQS
jgi:glyoxylase-like metal-dependent hydrolase (beta-lactamase superfamily II)